MRVKPKIYASLLITIIYFFVIRSYGQSLTNDNVSIEPQALLRVCVLQDLVQTFSKSEKASQVFGAYFLNIQSNDFVHAKITLTNSRPRIEFGTNNVIDRKDGVFDKLTKKPAVVFNAEVKSISSKKAEVEGSTYFGPEGGGYYRYIFEKSEKGIWTIRQRTLVGAL